MFRKLLLLVFLSLAAGCETPTDRHRITLLDIAPEFGLRYESEAEFNALHPSHTASGDGGFRIAWTDLCEAKECSDERMRYTRLFLEVAITAATVEQLHFVVERVEAAEIDSNEVEEFLELGWKQLPRIGERIAEQRDALEQLDPGRDLKGAALRDDAWQGIADAAAQLERAGSRLGGLDRAVAELYRNLEPALACEEPEPIDGIVLELSPETEERLVRLASKDDEEAPTAREAVSRVLRQGLAALERDRAAAREKVRLGDAPVVLRELEVGGPIDPDAVHAWFDERTDVVGSCLPSDATEVSRVRVLALYTPETVVAEAYDEADSGGSADVATIGCVVEAVEAALADQEPTAAGSARITLQLQPDPNR